MKTEMKMMDNGNYDRVVSPIQHECVSEDYNWRCREYSWDIGKLHLDVDEGYGLDIIVNFCPFCGYTPEKK